MMYETVKRGVRCAVIAALAIGVPAGVAHAQEGEAAAEDVQNVLLTFHLIEADGFTDQDPEISEVVSELRGIFNFQGYRLLSTSVFNVGLSGRPGSPFVEGDGSQRIFAGDSKTQLTIMAEVDSRRSTGSVRAKVILTDELMRASDGHLFRDERLPLLEVTVTIRDGQRVMVGSATPAPGAPVLILVVTPRIDP